MFGQYSIRVAADVDVGYEKLRISYVRGARNGVILCRLQLSERCYRVSLDVYGKNSPCKQPVL